MNKYLNIDIFYEDSIRYNNSIWKKINKSVDLYSITRAGGTFLWQVLACLFDPPPQIIQDTRSDIEYIVSSYRDWRDKLASHYRVIEGDKQTRLEKAFKEIEIGVQLLNNLESYRKTHKNQVLLLQYEKFFENYPYLFNKIEGFFKINIPKEVKNLIEKYTNLEINKRRVLSFGRVNFDYNDRKGSKLHGDHIYSGKPGSWKEVIPLKYHRLVEKRLYSYLKRWNYI